MDVDNLTDQEKEKLIEFTTQVARDVTVEMLTPVQEIIDGLSEQVSIGMDEALLAKQQLAEHKKLILGPPFKEAIVYRLETMQQWKDQKLELGEQSKESGIIKSGTTGLSNLAGSKNFWRIIVLIVLVIFGILAYRWNGDAYGPGSGSPSVPIYDPTEQVVP